MIFAVGVKIVFSRTIHVASWLVLLNCSFWIVQYPGFPILLVSVVNWLQKITVTLKLNKSVEGIFHMELEDVHRSLQNYLATNHN